MLKFNLLQILDELIQYDIPVYISDDSTDEETGKMIAELKQQHSLFYYYKNEIRFGHDLNCLNTISLPKEQYVWYMGDSMIIKKGAVKKVLDCIKDQDYDFIACNAEGRDFELKTQVFTNPKELFEKLCWHLTMTGATIYNKDRLLEFSKFDVTKFKNFPQTALVFEHFAVKEATLLWMNDSLIYANSGKNSYWASKVFDVFFNDFKQFMFNLNKGYSSKSKGIVISAHSNNSGIFNYRSFLKYRMEGAFNYKTFCAYKEDINKYTHANSYVVFFISQCPRPLLKLARRFF
jgi:hypothetical protein